MDLTTRYLGMDLKNPIVHSASPLSEKTAAIRRLEDVGTSAIVMYSLFEEQITHDSHTLDHYLSYGTESSAEALDYFPEAETYKVGPDEYLERIRKAKEAVDIPIIGSLNGVSTGGALELNVYFIPTDPFMAGAEVEQMYVDVVRDVRKTVTIPVAVKVSPFFSAIGNMVRQLCEVGADGMVLFNRFYQPDFDLEKLDVVPHLVLSNSFDMRLPLRWIAILHGRVQCDLALSRGVHTHLDVLKGLMAGASVTMMTSELLRNGIDRVGQILDSMARWMEEHEYESVKQMQGSMSQKHVKEPAAFERANYMRVLHSWRPDPTGRLHY